MEAIPFFPKFVTYFPLVCAVISFLFSFSQKQYQSWEETFGEQKAKKIQMSMRYIAPPIMIVCGIGQILLR